MTLPETISADYTLRPTELAEVLALLVEALTHLRRDVAHEKAVVHRIE